MKYLGSSGLTRLVELINERFATKTELNGKANSTHEHSYAGSSTAGGAATSANKINTDAGSATQPVYFDNGVPVATTYALNATVPVGAKFTDTTYENATTSEAGLMSAADKTIVNGIATTYAPLSSPVFTGTPVAPTPTTGDDSTKIATTAFVNDAISNIPSSTEWDDIVNKPSTFEPATHTHNYAASSTAGGSALSAEKINANAGSPSQPIYFNNGIPVATTYALNKTVPADAIFTDTTVGSDITLTGYSKPASTSAIAAADTVNQAIGKLEKALDGKPDTSEFTVLTEAEIYTLFGVSIPKTPFNLVNYAANNITDYGNITTLPQENIEELTNIMPESDASSAFYNCKNITSLSGVEQTWDTSNVTNMGVMFNRCLALTSLDVSDWNTSNVTDTNSMFMNCRALTSLDLSNWDTSSILNMTMMFNNCLALTTLDLSNWDTSNMTDNMSMTFNNCNALQYLILESSVFKFQLFPNNDLNNTCKILVPQALISTYQTAANWSDHASQFEPIENYTITRSNGQVTVTPKNN